MSYMEIQSAFELDNNCMPSFGRTKQQHFIHVAQAECAKPGYKLKPGVTIKITILMQLPIHMHVQQQVADTAATMRRQSSCQVPWHMHNKHIDRT